MSEARRRGAGVEALGVPNSGGWRGTPTFEISSSCAPLVASRPRAERCLGATLPKQHDYRVAATLRVAQSVRFFIPQWPSDHEGQAGPVRAVQFCVVISGSGSTIL
jgi:hypothetical protein